MGGSFRNARKVPVVGEYKRPWLQRRGALAVDANRAELDPMAKFPSEPTSGGRK
jgi:hypothetical protein